MLKPNRHSLALALGLSLAAFPLCVNPALGQDEPVKAGGTPSKEAPPFDPSKAVDAGLGMPTPYDKFLALDLVLKGKVNWKSYFSKTAVDVPVDEITDTKVQLPLLLGVRISDGVMAIKARDAELLNKCASEIEAAAKKLGTPDSDLARAKAVRTAANAGEWLKVFMELGFLQQDILKTLDKSENKAQGSLVTIGGWLQGARYVTSVIEDNYSPANSNYLREPLLIKALLDKIDKLPADAKSSPIVAKAKTSLTEIGDIVNIKLDGSIPKEKVERLHTLATDTVSTAMSGK